MAIQVSGTTVIDNSRNITNGGSGSFSSTVTVGAQSSSGHLTRKSYVDSLVSGAGGEILQIVSTHTTSQSNSATGTSWTQLSTLNRSITISSSSSKILIVASVCFGSNAQYAYFAFSRNGSRIGTGSDESSAPGISGGRVLDDDDFVNQWGGSYLDSPGSSSGTTLTYGIQFRPGAPSGDIIYVNRSAVASGEYYHINGASNITLYEIKP